jgi:hypothetical protein
MRNEGLEKVISKIAEEVVTLATLILEDDSISTNTKVNKNTLRESALRYNIDTSTGIFSGGDTVIKALFNHYVTFIEWDRPPKYGKQPPISALKDWAEKNGIPSDNNTLWAISTAIWRDGHTGRPIFATLEKEVDKMFNEDWAEEIFNSVVEKLDTYFK